MHLPARDYEHVLGMIETIYSIPDRAAMFGTLCRKLQALSIIHSGVLTPIEPRARSCYCDSFALFNRRFDFLRTMELVTCGELVGTCRFYRHRNAGDFGDREMRVMGLLLPHMARAIRREQAGATCGLAGFSLTHREEEVATLALQGLSNLEVAHRLFIAEQTVKDHLHSVFAKAGVHRRGELAAKVLGAPQPAVH